MRIAMLLPTADRPSTRGYALWCRSARQVARALDQRGLDVQVLSVSDPAPGKPLHLADGVGEIQTLPIANLYQRATEFDVIHTLLGAPGLTYASFVDVPVLATIWHDMWPQATALFERLDGTVFYIAPTDGDRHKGLRYTATTPWGQDLASLAIPAERGEHLVYFGSLDDTVRLEQAIEIAEKTSHSIVLVGSPSDPTVFDRLVTPRLGDNVRHIADPLSEDADTAIGTALAVLHPATEPGLDQLAVADAAARGTPTICVSDDQTVTCLEAEVSCWRADNTQQAIALVGKLAGIDREACRESVIREHDLATFVPKLASVYAEIIERNHREDHRPWGYYVVLADEPDHKVKRIVVYPDKRLSLQRHQHRAEHWFVVSGEGMVTLDEDEIRVLPGQSAEIPKGCWHRIRNPGNENLTFIEVQTGDYFGEDDIERSEDDYGRV